jgi:carboxypeptidase Q
VTIEDAAMLHRMQARGQRLRVRLTMGCTTLPDFESRNLVAELRGAELPQEVVLLSGHLDSWDVGQGALDDAAGVFISWQALSTLARLEAPDPICSRPDGRSIRLRPAPR